jgi:POT family proton-dependent oligopeptide transporter
MQSDPETIASERNWFGQPPGLTVLFLTNMWEQFSYFGMRALLVYYMTRQLMLGQVKASFVYGAYTACAYFTPIVGGMIADRWLGKRLAVTLGATIMAMGHFMMAFDTLFYVALATIALGNGLFLPSLPSQINDLYAPGDPRRGWAYNVYYLGINIGGFLAPLVCGTLGEVYGWHYGFGAAGIGMFVGLLVYLLGQRHLPPERKLPALVEDGANGLHVEYRQVWLALAAVGLCVTVFRGAYEQVGNTVALWADSGIDRQVGALTIPMTWFQSLNPLMVMMLTPPLLSWWRRRADKGQDTSPVRRMTQGALIVALAYVLLAVVAWNAGAGKANWLWMGLFFTLFTLGELFILPTGLGLFARLAPPRLGATTVAAWYLAIFTGSLLAGLVGSLWSRMDHSTYFALLAVIATLSAALLRLLDRSVRRIDQMGLGQ